jgi:hypothetical protein
MVIRKAAMLLAGAVLLSAAAPSPCPTCKGNGTTASAEADALKGVWLSIESPVNPYDNANQGVFLMVHTFWMHGPAAMAVEGRAEGMVNGQRRTVPLVFQDRGDGVYALSQIWPKEGHWALVITGRNRGQQATVLVRISDENRIAAVQVTPDKTVSEADVAVALR